ncbi:MULTISPECIES: hypothetical protein [unclassified Rhizobium]|uniref:hypothetical protein n=1 Tax=unclassified Rhizobium TaxID=2613769 RepID=UPI0004017C90|nr:MULTISPECIES: hypothetical protein [unclassified Rhizobium]NMN74225.1 hypothetical protein [Rhizobium sp. 57MFTsu3.2]
MQFPTFITLESVEVEVLPSVVNARQGNQTDPKSECAGAVTATALDLIEAGFRTRESLSMALANAPHPGA